MAKWALVHSMTISITNTQLWLQHTTHLFEIISLIRPGCLLFSLESNKKECKLVNIDRAPTVSRVLYSMQWQTAIYSKCLAIV